MVSQKLGAWGVRSAPAYNALLNLAYRWFDPGVNRYPVGRGGHYVQAQDSDRYPELSDADVVAITRPLATRADTAESGGRRMGDTAGPRGRRGAPHQWPPRVAFPDVK